VFVGVARVAFALEPASVGPVDWLFSDIVCYPRAALAAHRALAPARGLVKNFVCTLKFQGETDHESARAFAVLPGGRRFCICITTSTSLLSC